MAITQIPESDMPPAAKFSTELRALVSRWAFKEANLPISVIVGVIECHKHELLTRQFEDLRRRFPSRDDAR